MVWKIVSAALLATALASAQRSGGNRGMDDSANDTAWHSRTPSKFDQFADKLKLNIDQKAAARSIIMDAVRDETGPLQQQLMLARQNLAGALIAGDSAQADQMAAQYAPLVAKLASVEAKSFGKICALLKPNQQSKAGQAFEILAGIYEPSPNQGGARRER